MPKLYEYLAIVLALAAFGAVCYVKGGEGPKAALAAKTAQFEAFQASVKALGDAAQKASDARKAKDIADKEKADHENATAHAVDTATIAKLRHDLDARTNGNYLPAAPASSGNPSLACFDRASLEFAVRDFIADIRGQVDQGTAATIDLNPAKAWAASP